MITWPALLKLDGDDELLYLPSQQAFLDECQSLIFSPDDLVIDTQGQSFQLEKIGAEPLSLVPHTKHFSLDQVTHLIQAHEFSKAEMCITKIYFKTIAEAIQALAYEHSS